MNKQCRDQFSPLWIAAALAIVLLPSADSTADPAAEAKSPLKYQCSFYRSKKEKIPVYREADSSSKVVYKLKLGQEVCYIGEQAGFAIINWPATVGEDAAAEMLKVEEKAQQAGEPEPGQTGLSDGKLVFIRLVDLWPPRSGRSLSTRRRSISEKVSDFFTYFKGGGVPENPLMPLGIGSSPGDQPVVPQPKKDDSCGCGAEE